MAPYYGPDEDAKTIQLERVFVAGDFVAGVGYGMQLIFYCICTRQLWSARQKGRQAIFLLIYTTLLLCVETIFQVVQAYTVQLMYVDNRNYPGGPWTYFLATQDLPVNVAFIASLFLLTFFADLLVLWRCWIIWSAQGKLGAYLACFFPTLLLLTSFALGVLWTLQSSQPGLSLYTGKLAIVLGTCYYSVSLSANIILTALIAFRLLAYQRTIIQHLPSEYGREYVSLAAIIIESASLYSVFAFICLVLYAVNNPVNSAFLTIASTAQQIANYLIIIRLSQGRGWRQDTLARTDDTFISQIARGQLEPSISRKESHNSDTPQRANVTA